MLALFKARLHENEIPDGIFPKRQVVGTSATTSRTTITETTQITVSMSVVESTGTTTVPVTTTPTTSTETTPTTTSTTTPTTTTEPVTTPTTATTPTTPITTPTTTTPTTTTRPTMTTPTTSSTSRTSTSSTPLAVTSSDVVVVGSTTINRSSLTGATTITSALLGMETDSVLTTSYWTSNGQTYSSVYTTSRVVSSTTGYATATIEPVLASDNSGGGSSLSPHSQAIIGGVVGGVGGAILLGGLAFVAWRLWGKKKGEKLPQDDYYTGREELQKEGDTDGLERYRTPGQPAMSVNAASNF